MLSCWNKIFSDHNDSNIYIALLSLEEKKSSMYDRNKYVDGLGLGRFALFLASQMKQIVLALHSIKGGFD